MTNNGNASQEKIAAALWSSFFFNPIAVGESDQFKKKLVNSLKKFPPRNFTIEELNAFIVFQVKFDERLFASATSPSTSPSSFHGPLKGQLEAVYQEYLLKLQQRYLNRIKKNRELKEATNILAHCLSKSAEAKEQFSMTLRDALESCGEDYLEVIKNAPIFIWEFPKQANALIDLGDIRLETHTEKTVSRLVDELTLYNFARAFGPKTKTLLEKFLHSLDSVIDLLQGMERKSRALEEILRLLKGKSLEVADKILDLRRQLARQSRAKEEVASEAKEISDATLLKTIDEKSPMKLITEIFLLTDKANERLDAWFALVRKIDAIEKAAETVALSSELIQAIDDFFISMELLRIWSEFFYDITYFASSIGGIAGSVEADFAANGSIETDAVLVVRNVYKTYKLPQSRVYALRGVSFEVQPGEFLAIMGPSGAGKTTLINILTGLDSADKGKVFLNGQNIALMNDTAITKFRRDQIGFVFQFYQLFAELTALENVSMPAEMAGIPVKEAREKALTLLEIVGLKKFANQYPDKLSGGQQQRVAIARALINDPAIVVADQITGDLDSVTGQQIIDLLRTINKERGATILLATHNKLIATQADRILHIEDGEIIEETDMTLLREADSSGDVFSLKERKNGTQ